MVTMMNTLDYGDDDELNEMNQQVCSPSSALLRAWCGNEAEMQSVWRFCSASPCGVRLCCLPRQLESSVRENEQLMCENELFASYLSRHASVCASCCQAFCWSALAYAFVA